MASAKGNGASGGDDEAADPDADARQRLALTRVLIWAEREAASQGRGDVAERLRDVISALHRAK